MGKSCPSDFSTKRLFPRPSYPQILLKSQKDKVLKGLSVKDIAQIFDDLLSYAHFSFERPYEGSRADHAQLRLFTSRLIGRFINAFTLKERDKHGSCSVERQILPEQEIAILKQLTWCYVINAPALAMQRVAQTKAIERLFEIFHEEAHAKTPSGVLPVYYRDVLKQGHLKKKDKSRAAVDLIASMTESQVIATYHRLEGINFHPGLDKILV